MPARDRLDTLSDAWNARRPEVDIQPWRVWGRITRLNELFRAAIAPALSRHELTFAEYQTLGALVLAGPPYEASPTEIARFNLLTSGGLANLLGRMERNGFLERRARDGDRRGVTVRLSERGLQLFESALLAENAIEHKRIAVLTPEEREILSVLLRKLLLSLETDAQ